MNSLVSVIITTKNEEANIANCLKSVLAQTYPQDKIEIIVVDNNSTDKTKEIVFFFCHSRPSCRSAAEADAPLLCHSRLPAVGRRKRESRKSYSKII